MTTRSLPVLHRSRSLGRIAALLVLAGGPAGAVHAHDDCTSHHVHQTLLDLLPIGEAQCVAVRNGAWTDTSTWALGHIPGDGATAIIPEGIRVTVDAVLSDRVRVVRVDGELAFAPDRSTRLVADTVFSAPHGVIAMGTPAAPIAPQHTAEIVITGDGPIDTAWDPEQLSRGLIPHGPTTIVGAARLPFAPLAGDAPAGATELVLDLPEGQAEPLGWRIGDRLVLAGTRHDPAGSDEDNTRSHDEVLTITAIEGDRVRFVNEGITAGDRARLRFDHTRPAGHDGLNIYVANLTRNAVVRSEDTDAPIGQRGHVMFMHHNAVLVENAGFYGLGRSDKNRLADDPGVNVDGSPGGGTNPRGRYAVHFHRNMPHGGVVPEGCSPAVARNSVVWGSPGWGLVHHDSHCDFVGNVVFDVVGSAIVAEAGNEIGRWTGNLTIKTTGDDDPRQTFDLSPRVPLFDFGFNGEGYWVQGGAQVEMVGNAAVSAGAGINIFSGVDGNDQRDKGYIPAEHLREDHRHIVTHGDAIDVTNVPLRRFEGFECSNSDLGIVFWNHMRNDDGQLGFICPCDFNNHRERSLVEGFRLWNIHGEGVFLQYSTQVDFRDGLVLGNPADPVRVRRGINGEGRGHGIGMNGPAQSLTFEDIRIEGFERGLRLPREGSDTRTVPYARSRLIGGSFANNLTNLSKKEANFGPPEPFPEFFEIVGTTFAPPPADLPPVPAFGWEALGGQGVVRLDAGASFDPDPPASLELTGNAIAAYAWDLDADGQPDAYGREVLHAFAGPGPHGVTLTVWDAHGQSASTWQEVSTNPQPYTNPLADPGFDQPLASPGWQFETTRPGEWFGRDAQVVDGAARMLGQQWGISGLGQILYDRAAHRGRFALGFDVRNLSAGANNSITVELWGVHGEFLGSPEGDGPFQDGAIPMAADLLVQRTLAWPFDWSTYSCTVDLGEGYEFFYLQFRGRGINAAAGDDVRIDNVTFTPACPADLTGDGVISPSDIDAFAAAFRARSPAADLWPDGVINLDDLEYFVQRYLEGC